MIEPLSSDVRHVFLPNMELIRNMEIIEIFRSNPAIPEKVYPSISETSDNWNESGWPFKLVSNDETLRVHTLDRMIITEIDHKGIMVALPSLLSLKFCDRITTFSEQIL